MVQLSLTKARKIAGFKNTNFCQLTKSHQYNFMNSIMQYLNDVKVELRQTTFPSRATVISFTSFVVLFTAVMAVYFGALDLGFGEAVLKIIANLKK